MTPQERRLYKTNLDHGVIEIEIPERLSKFDVDYIEEYFGIVLRQCRRRQEEDQS